MKQVFALFAILIIIILAVVISQNYLQTSNFNNVNTNSKIPTATINNHAFKLDIEITEKEKQIGLSQLKTLSQDHGMLFQFENPAYYPFWTKNMKFPIDIIFIKNGHIVTIYKDAMPPKTPNENLPVYNSKEPADTVLEINAGLSEKYNFKEGDEVKLSL